MKELYKQVSPDQWLWDIRRPPEKIKIKTDDKRHTRKKLCYSIEQIQNFVNGLDPRYYLDPQTPKIIMREENIKIIDSLSDNVFYVTYQKLMQKSSANVKLFVRHQINKFKKIEEMQKKYGKDRFDFSESEFLSNRILISFFDNYLQREQQYMYSSMAKIAMVNKPNRPIVISKLLLKFGPDRFDMSTLEYINDRVKIKIYDLKKQKYILFLLSGIDKVPNWNPRKRIVRNRISNDEKLANLRRARPGYYFDEKDFLGPEAFIKYVDLSNGETYVHQNYQQLMSGAKRMNSTLLNVEDATKYLLKHYPNVDISTIIFNNSVLKFETKFFIGTNTVVTFKLLGGKHTWEMRSHFLKNSSIGQRKLYTEKDVINLFKSINPKSGKFSLKHIQFTEGVDNISSKKVKIFNNHTQKFWYVTYGKFRNHFMLSRSDTRESNRFSYIYLDRSETTKTGHVDVICPEHGLFSQWSHNHFYRGDCCPLCNASIGETKIYEYFITNDIKFIFKYKAHKLMNVDYLRFDFYLPEFDIYIQFNGEQHHKTVMWANSMSLAELNANLIQEQHHDELKFNYCQKNHLDFIVLDYWQRDDIEVHLENELKKITEKRKEKNATIESRTDS